MAGEVHGRTFSPEPPAPADADVAEGAWRAAAALWDRLPGAGVSRGFARIAHANAAAVRGLEPAIRRLPRRP